MSSQSFMLAQEPLLQEKHGRQRQQLLFFTISILTWWPSGASCRSQRIEMADATIYLRVVLGTYGYQCWCHTDRDNKIQSLQSAYSVLLTRSPFSLSNLSPVACGASQFQDSRHHCVMKKAIKHPDTLAWECAGDMIFTGKKCCVL